LVRLGKVSIAVKTFGICDFSRLAVMDWRFVPLGAYDSYWYPKCVYEGEGELSNYETENVSTHGTDVSLKPWFLSVAVLA